MAINSVSTLLSLANLRMAAEAVRLDEVDAGTLSLEVALTDGNGHASLFPPTLAKAFAVDGEWVVVDHEPNTHTGFSATLFKNKNTDELAISSRSTKFIDDAARDNEATNKFEIGKLGWAFGQIGDMEAWWERIGPHVGSTPLTVTGYSLGAHLATAFKLMHRLEVPQMRVVTFSERSGEQSSDGPRQNLDAPKNSQSPVAAGMPTPSRDWAVFGKPINANPVTWQAEPARLRWSGLPEAGAAGPKNAPWSLQTDRVDAGALISGQGYGDAQQRLWVEDALGARAPTDRAATDQASCAVGWDATTTVRAIGGDGNLTRRADSLELSVDSLSPLPSGASEGWRMSAELVGPRFGSAGNSASLASRAHAC